MENALIFKQIFTFNSLKEMYGDQFWEFEFGYWGLKS